MKISLQTCVAVSPRKQLTNKQKEKYMMKKYGSMMVIALLLQLSVVDCVQAESRMEKEARFAEKVKAAIFKIGVGEQAKVKIKLRDQRNLEGYVSEAGEGLFTIQDTNTGAAIPV